MRTHERFVVHRLVTNKYVCTQYAHSDGYLGSVVLVAKGRKGRIQQIVSLLIGCNGSDAHFR